MFRRGVSALTCEAFDASARSGVYNRAASLLEHQRNLVFQAQKDAAEIDTDDAVPFLLGDFGSGRDWLFNACVVEGKVKASEYFYCLVQRSLHVFSARHVAPDRERAPAEFLDHAGGLLVAFFRDIGDHHVCALAGERQRGGAADAVRCAGHKRNPSCERSILVHSHFLLLLCWIISPDTRRRSPFPSSRRPCRRALPEWRCASLLSPTRRQPMFLVRREPDHIAGADLLDRSALALHSTAAGGDDERLT